MGCSPSTLGAQQGEMGKNPPGTHQSLALTVLSPSGGDMDAPGLRRQGACGAQTSLAVALRARRWADARAAVVSRPASARCEDPQTGDLPLHVILSANPLSRSMRNLQNKHGSIIEKFLEACKAIAEAFPEASERRGSELGTLRGALPLHLLCMSRALNNIWSPQLEARLCRHRCEVLASELVDLVVSAFPAACAELAPGGLRHMMRVVQGLPLHIALTCQAPESTIERLLSEYPAACREATPSGEYPLHLAAEHHATPTLIRNLLRVYPEACAIEDKLGLLPLHIVLKQGAISSTIEIVQQLIAAHPEACAQYENGRNLPLHLACKHSGKVDPATIEQTLKLLVAQYPAGCSELDSNHELPLHHAIRQMMSAGGIKCLLETHSHACLVPDKDDKLPLHAVIANCDHEVETVRAIVKYCPAACEQKDSHGDLPIHAGIRHRRRHADPNTSALDELFRASAKSFSVKNDDSHTPIDIARNSTEKLRMWAITCRAFLRRYTITGEIRTSTAKIMFGKDELSHSHSVDYDQVCVKCVRDRVVLENEVRRRYGRSIPLSSKAVIRVLHWHTPENDSFSFNSSTEEAEHTQSDDEYPYVIVMPRAECSLFDACYSERLARYDLPGIRSSMWQVANCMQALHREQLVHGNITQRNILRMRDSTGDAFYVLCDLNTSNVVGDPLGWTAPAYAPPELAKLQHTCTCGRSRTCRTCRIRFAEKSFDVWGFGVVFFEMCAGRALFNQDMSNGDLVDQTDCCRLCMWLTISDEELEPILSSTTVTVNQTVRDAAKHLVRWCLNGNASLRPTVEQILEHQFFRFMNNQLTNASECTELALPPLRPIMPMRYYAFMSHAQRDASGTVGTLYLMYKQLGLHNWLDMHQESITLDAMQQGVCDSSVFILILTKNVLGSWFCQKEITWAIKAQKQIQLIVEEDERFGAFDVKKWRESRLRSRVFEWPGARNLPVEICTMIDNHLNNAVTFRRRHFESESMMRELCRRSGLTLPIASTAQTDAAAAALANDKTISVFVIYQKDSGFKILRTLQTELENRKRSRCYGGHIEITTQVEKMSSAETVLLVLTPGVLQGPWLGQLQQVLDRSMKDHKDRLTVVYSCSTDDGWDFNSTEQNCAPQQVQECLHEHEAIAWRPCDPDGPNRHEFPAMTDELVRRMTPAATVTSIPTPTKRSLFIRTTSQVAD